MAKKVPGLHVHSLMIGDNVIQVLMIIVIMILIVILIIIIILTIMIIFTKIMAIAGP